MVLLNIFSNFKYFHRHINYCRILTRSSSNAQEACQIQGSEGKQSDGSKKGLVLGVFENEKKFELTPAAEEVNQKSGGKINRHLNELASELRLGKAFILTDILDEYSAVALTSFGSKTAGYNPLESLDEGRENIRWGVGAGVGLLRRRGCAGVAVDAAGAPDAAAEAAHLAAWRFQEFRSTEVKPECELSLYGADGEQEWRVGSVMGRGQNWARFLSDMPANRMTPVDLAQAALDVLCPLGLLVEVFDEQWCREQRMEALLAVGGGSCGRTLVLQCRYEGAGDQRPPTLLTAKGVTFDSGGLCLKGGEAMRENRGSMAGAAVVLAALRILATLKVPLNLCAVIPLCENMVSGQCMKVGDVVQALNGLSIQIENTDMEGRLMLADALVYGQAVHKPSLVIDVATLTHGVLLGTGGGAFGCFSNVGALWERAREAGAAAGDRPWRLPLWDYYHRQITDDPSVDLRNKGSGKATPCLGAAFLKRFVCCDWLHWDITGVGKVGHRQAPPYLHARRMTGRPTRTLAALLRRLAHDNSSLQQ